MITQVPGPTRAGLRALAAAAAVFVFSMGASASAAQLLEVIPSDDVAGTIRVGVRDGADQTPKVVANGKDVDLQVADRKTSLRWQPLVMMVDTANVSAGQLDKIKQNVVGITKREFAGGSQYVKVVGDDGNGDQMNNPETAESRAQALVDGWTARPAPNPKKPNWSNVGAFLGGAFAAPSVSRARPWGLVFSSLCVSPDLNVPDLSGFPGPIRFLTWNNDLPKGCLEQREAFLAKVRETKKDIEVLDIADPAQAEAVKKARAGRSDITDESMILSGVPYDGGALLLSVSVEGSEPWKGGYTDESAPSEWSRQATIASQAKSRKMMIGGFGLLVILVLLGAVVRARTSAAEVGKWEAVGEAEDLSATMDPDAWNATIFQLTGAMPVLAEVREAAQLGPGKEKKKKKAKPAPKAKAEPKVEVAPVPPEGSESTQNVGPQTPATPGNTGMTVAMPVLDDGTGYDADTPFEIGVLLRGKPVARKTKKFRKVFSIGRATDNRVVIQKDDTVHRYHVVVRPALQGKEWWLEVSPTATNRTNLNGKDLRAGGRYRLPARFRLQLGEATEVRGRAATD